MVFNNAASNGISAGASSASSFPSIRLRRTLKTVGRSASADGHLDAASYRAGRKAEQSEIFPAP